MICGAHCGEQRSLCKCNLICKHRFNRLITVWLLVVLHSFVNYTWVSSDQKCLNCPRNRHSYDTLHMKKGLEMYKEVTYPEHYLYRLSVSLILSVCCFLASVFSLLRYYFSFPFDQAMSEKQQ